MSKLNFDTLLGQLTDDDARELATLCLSQLTEIDQIDTIAQFCANETMAFSDEVIAAIQEIWA